MAAKKPGSLRIGSSLLQLLLDDEAYSEKSGDLEESYNILAGEAGKSKADLWYWRQLAKLIPAHLRNSLAWRLVMFFNNLKVAWRYLYKFKGYSLINMISLAIGIAFCILTYLFVHHEYSYDNFHENGDRIYLAFHLRASSGGGKASGSTPPILAPTLDGNIAGIERTARVFGWYIKDGIPVRHQDKTMIMQGYYVDTAFFQMFSFPQIAGQPETALDEKHGIVITADMAERFFGHSDPLGQEIAIQLQGEEDFFLVKGVVDLPANSSLRFDFLVSYDLKAPHATHWGANNVYTFIQLSDTTNHADMEKQFGAFFSDHFRERQQNQESYFGSPDRPLRLLPLKKLYLNSVIRKWLTIQSDPEYSYILSGIALAVLLIACFNFINLSLGLSSRRFKEVGMRKVVGARRSQLMRQYLSESLLLVFLSLLAGAGLASLSIPTFSRLLERNLSFDLQIMIVPFFGLIFLVGLLAGLYPAFVLSRLHPVDILKKRFQMQSKKGLRSLLVVVQFGLSIILIIMTLSMARQMQFMRKKNLGFNADHLMVMDAGGGGTGLNEAECRRVLSVYRQAVSQQRDLLSATMTSMSFGRRDSWGTGFEFQNKSFSCRMYSIDYDYAKTLGMRIVQGREFSPDFPGDRENSVVVNESLVRVFGWEDPIGQTIPVDNDMLSGKIIGVFADSHLRSLHYEVVPAVFHLKVINGSFRFILIRLSSENVPETLNLLEDIWKRMVPERPFLFSFLDEDVDRVFKEDERWVDISRYSALFAILIACLGAFSLTSLALARRTKEVGVRKVLGASVIRIALLLTRDLFTLILFANAIAWPLAYFLLRVWLQDFAYRTTLSIEVFLLGAFLTFLIAMATISIQVLKAAKSDPVNSLRYE